MYGACTLTVSFDLQSGARRPRQPAAQESPHGARTPPHDAEAKFVRLERKARRQHPQAPGYFSLGHRCQFFAFQAFGPLLADLSAIRSETIFALATTTHSLSTLPRAFHIATATRELMAVRELRATIANPVTTFRRALAVSTTCSWASATDRPRILHPRPGSSFEANRSYPCSVMAALTTRPAT